MKIYVRTFLILTLGFGLSAALGWAFLKNETNLILEQFRQDIDDKAASLERELSLNFEAIYALKSLYDSSEDVNADEFAIAAKSVMARRSAISALDWAPRVPQAERAAYEEQRREGLPAFEITEREGQVQMVRAKEREEYYPVYFVEPLAGNEAVLGFDMAADAARARALEAARDSGQMVATEGVRLIQDPSHRMGILVFLPVYEGRPATAEERRDRLDGFVIGVFSIEEIFQSAIQQTLSSDIHPALIDVTSSKTVTLCARELESASTDAARRFEYQSRLPDVAGRKWAIVATPAKAYFKARRGALPGIIFAFGALFVSLGAAYTASVLRRAAVIEQVVRQRTQELQIARDHLERIAMVDGLTGVANRRRFADYLESEWKRALREKTPLSIVMADIDFFKPYNDHYGHLPGDTCLRDVAQSLAASCNRPADLVARYGGEEFALILPNTKNGQAVAEKCRRRVENLGIPHGHSAVASVVTISVGVCSMIPAEDAGPETLVHAADQALYRAKTAGRNRVA